MLNQFNQKTYGNYQDDEKEKSIQEIYNELLKECNLNEKAGKNQPATIKAMKNSPLLFQPTIRNRGDRPILPRPPERTIRLTDNDRLDQSVLFEIDRIKYPKPTPQRVYRALDISSMVFYDSRRRLTEKGYINGEPWYKITEKGKQYLAELKSSMENVNIIYIRHQKDQP